MTFWVTFWLWVATFVITDYFRQRLPTQTPSGLGDFTVPTATEGRFVPLVFGTMVVEGPNVIWYGDFTYEELTVTTGIIFREDETIGYRYFLGLQLCLLRGRCAGVRRIWIGDDVVWDYTIDNGGNLGTVCDVNEPDLFGGTKEGGGFIGRFRLYDGTQTAVSPYMATQVASTILPAYKGFTYLVVTNLTEDGGAEIGESNSLRRMKFEVQTYDTVANGGLGDTLGLGNNHHIIGNDLNPVVLAWDVFTNTDWGRGISPADLNQANFEAAAETVWTEGYGFSMVVDQVTTSKEMLDIIEQHIDGYIGPNPETGLIEVNLARQDYTLASEFQLTEDNVISVSKFSRGENNQTFNEVRVQYLDRGKNYGDTYAPAQDLANLAIQGRRKSRINRMPGVHDATVASKIAWRDLRGATRPLATATVEVNREAWVLRPGDVVSLTDAEVGITNLAMRITAVRQGEPTNNTVVLDLVEDVFGNEPTGFPEPPVTEFLPPSLVVQNLAATDAFVIDAPKRIVDEDGALGTGLYAYPRVLAGLRPNVGGAATQFDLRVDAPKNAISPEFPSAGLFSGGMRYGVLSSSLGGWAAGNGTFSITVDPPGSPIVAGGLDALIGTYTPGGYGALGGLCVINPGGANEEWVIADTIVDGGAGITLQNVWRGALDTIIEAHSAGEEIWFLWTGGVGISTASYAAGQAYEVKILPRSNTDSIGLYDSPLPPSQKDSTFDNPARASRPPPIISLSLNGSEFPTGNVDFDNVLDTVSPLIQGVLATQVYKPYNSSSDIVLQVQGFKESGTIMQSADFLDENWTVQWWLFDLDTTPSPTRGVDEIASSGGPVSITQQNNPIYIDKQGLTPYPAKNSFAARIEFQVKFDPTGSGTPIVARDDLQWDFTAIGTWVVPRSAVFLDLVTEGNSASRRFVDRSDSVYPIVAVGATAGFTGTPPATSPAWHGSLALDMDPSDNDRSGLLAKDVLRTAMGRRLDMNQDWTLEFTCSFTLNSQRYTILNTSQTAASGNALNGAVPFGNWAYFTIDYDATQDRFEFGYSTNGTTETTGIALHNLTFVPVGGNAEKYRVMITRKDNGDGTITFRTFIDGVSYGSNTVASFTMYDFYANQSPLPVLHMGIGWGTQLFRDIAHSTSSSWDGWIDRVRLTLGYALELIPYQETTGEFTYTGSVVFQWGGRIEDGAAHRITVDSGETSVVLGTGSKITHEVEKFADVPVLYCTGVGSTTPEVAGRPLFGTSNIAEFHDIQAFLGNQDFTMEAHVYFLSLPSTNTNEGYAILGKSARNFSTADYALYVDHEHRLTWWGAPNGIYNNFKELKEDPPASPWPQSPLVGSISPDPIITGRWYHFAACREGDALSLYKDGVRVGYDADFFSTTFGGALVGLENDGGGGGTRYPMWVGGWWDAATAAQIKCLHGYVSEPRILKDVALYSGTTYTVPDEPFKPKRGTVVATRDERWSSYTTLHLRFNEESPLTSTTDEGPSGYALSFRGNAIINTSVQKYGTGCLELLNPGSPQSFIETSNLDDFLITGGFATVDCWVRFNSLPTAGNFATFAGMWSKTTSAGWRIGYHGTNGWTFENATNTSTASETFTWLPSPAPALNTWYHMRVSIWNSAVRIYIDGVLVVKAVKMLTNSAGAIFTSFRMGASATGSAEDDFFDGWLDEFHLTASECKNVRTFNQDFTPSENCFPDVTFLYGADYTQGWRGEGYDFVPFRDMSRFNCPHNSESVVYESAGYTDYLRPNGRDFFEYQYGSTAYHRFTQPTLDNSMGQEDFTIEMWFAFYSSSHLTRTETLLSHYDTTANNRQWYLSYAGDYAGFLSPDVADNSFIFAWWPPSTAGATNQELVLGAQYIPSPNLINNWTHIAVCNEGGILSLFINGVFTPWTFFRDRGAATWAVAGSPNGAEFRDYASPNGIWSAGSVDVNVGSLFTTTAVADIYTDDVRIIRGRALYPAGANFTPPNTFGRMDTIST